MAIRRYNRTPIIKGGTQFGTSDIRDIIKNAVDAGTIGFTERQLKENERLDIIAGQEYGDATLYWVIASASGIGWALQVPPGTLLRIPIDINEVASLVE